MQKGSQEMSKMFQKDMKAIAKTNEYKKLTAFMPTFKARCKEGTQWNCGKFLKAWRLQKQKVINAKSEMQRAKKNNKNGVISREFDNKAWYKLNIEYYKLKQLQYRGMYKIDAFKNLRNRVRAIVNTKEWQKLEDDWLSVTKDEQHQAVVDKQMELFTTALKTLKVSDKDKKWVDLRKSPILFETFHAMFVYFKAMKHGDLDPLVNFLVDGAYDPDYVQAVRPEFWEPKMMLVV